MVPSAPVGNIRANRKRSLTIEDSGLAEVHIGIAVEFERLADLARDPSHISLDDTLGAVMGIHDRVPLAFVQRQPERESGNGELLLVRNRQPASQALPHHQPRLAPVKRRASAATRCCTADSGTRAWPGSTFIVPGRS